MSQFSFENEIRNVLRMDAPITKAPVVRWQRKLNESSFNTSRNDSVHMTPMAKTPKKSVNASSSAVLNPKTPTNKGLFKTPHKTPGILIRAVFTSKLYFRHTDVYNHLIRLIMEEYDVCSCSSVLPVTVQLQLHLNS